MPDETKHLATWAKGIKNKRFSPLLVSEDSLEAAVNVLLAEGGAVTRQGSSVSHNATDLAGTIRALRQAIFPTNEQLYTVAQVDGDIPTEWEAKAVGPARWGHSLVYDSENGRYLLFGGGDDLTDYHNDLWEFNGLMWTELSPTGGPPTARHGHTAHYIAAQGAMYVIYGLGAGGVRHDVWKLDCSTLVWSEVTESGTAPSARHYHTGCVIGTNTIMICGGDDAPGGATISFTTYYDLNVTTGAWTQIVGTCDGFPVSREQFSLVYDGTNTCCIVGGLYDHEASTKTCYTLNRTTHHWTAIASLPTAIVPDPGGLYGHNSLFCSGYVVILAGGGIIGGVTNTYHLFYNLALGGSWSYIINNGGIGSRSLAALAMDDEGNIVIHGGNPGAALTSTYYGAKICTEAAGTGLIPGDGVWVSATTLPTAAAAFEKVLALSATAGRLSFETLGDRLILTEGIEKTPHVILPGVLSTDPVASWASPMRVLLTYDGSNYHDISQYVLDNDLDSIAAIGGITTRGYIVIISDVPTLNGLYFEFETPNTAGGTTTEFSEETTLDAITKINREDVGNGIAKFVKDGAGTGHFEGPAKPIVGAAVDNSGTLAGTVKVPIVGHGQVVGNVVKFTGTVAYNATYTLGAQTGGDADNLIIVHAYVAEVFANPDDEMRQQFTLGVAKNAPLVEPGVRVVFSDAEVSITAITPDGEGSGEVTLSADHATADCDLYGIIETDASVVSVAATTDVLTTLASFSPNSSIKPYGVFTQVIKGADLTNATYVKLRFYGGLAALNSIGPAEITSAWICERNTGSTPQGTPTDLTFNNGSAGASVNPRYTPWATGLVCALDKRVTYNDVNYQCNTAHTAGATFAGDAAKWNEIGVPYVDTDLILFTIDNAHDYLVQVTPVVTGTTSGSGMAALVPTFALTTKPYGDTHLIYWSGSFSGTTYGVAAIKQITGLTGALTAVTNLHVCTTNDSSQIDITGVDAFKKIEVTETLPGLAVAMYALSIDQRQTWLINDGAGIRTIAKLESGTWWYIDAVDVWHDTGSSDPYEALREAFAIAENVMEGPTMEAFGEADWADLVGYPTLDFAMGLWADGTDLPSVTNFSLKVIDYGGAETSRWSSGAWATVGTTDNTVSGGVSFGQNGTIVPTAGSMTSDYSVIAGIPGFPFRVNCRGTDVATTLTKVRMRALCQPLQSIGSGQSAAVAGFVFHDVSTGKIRDYAIELSDETYTELSSAVIPMETDDALYVGYLSPFTELELIMGDDTNQAVSTLTVSYWNGLEWTALTVIDGTSSGGETLNQRGKIRWSVPTDWKTNIPLEGLQYVDEFGTRMQILYWLKLTVSVNLTSTTAIAEAKVSPVPTPLVKYRHVGMLQNRIALANRPDAPDQIATSAPYAEYIWSGPFSNTYRLGGGAIFALLSAWNTIMAAQADRYTMIPQITGQETDLVPIEASRHVPINSQVVVKAPMSGSDDGSRPAIWFINQWGAYGCAGFQADAQQATGRFTCISDDVRWWDSAANVLPRLDKNYLYLSCGVYWPSQNLLLFAVPMLMDNAFNLSAVVDKGSGRVGLPATLHGLTTGNQITVTGTSYYDGTWTLHSSTTANEMVITTTYTAETLTATARWAKVGASQTTNNVIIAYDLTLNAWIGYFTIAAASMCTMFHTNTNAPGKLGDLGLYVGNYSGQILRLFAPDAEDDSGTAIQAMIRTPRLSFGSPEFEKYLRYLKLYAGTDGANIKVTVFTDGETTASYTEELTDFTGLRAKDFLPHGETENIHGNFFQFQLEFSGPSKIHGISLQYVPVRDIEGAEVTA